MIKTSRFSVTHALLYFSAALAVLCLILRAQGVLSFIEPRHVVTSGYEEESLFAMWKFLYGQQIYALVHEIPFAASYFNWLFYDFYGSIIAFVVRTLHLQDGWIPTIGRCVTLSMVMVGTVVTTRLLMGFSTQKSVSATIAFSLSILLWASPLIGFWALTVRPDILGVVFDITALCLLCGFLPKKPLLAVMLAALACYLSWSCKQINIVLPLTIGLYLLWEQKIKYLLVFSILLISGYLITIGFASEPMLKMLFFMDTAVPLSMETLKNNLLQFIKKSGAILFLFGVVIFNAMLNSKLRAALLQQPLFRLGACGVIAWSVTLLPASSKVGSAENYYFLLPFFLVLISVAALSLSTFKPKWQALALSGTSVIMIATLLIAMDLGLTGSLERQHAHNVNLKRCLTTLTPPLFVMNHYGALPWMNPDPQSFVLAYNYWSDRQAGVSFEENGIGGLIEKRFFKTLVLPKETSQRFDSSKLTGYQRQATDCAGYAVYQQRAAKT